MKAVGNANIEDLAQEMLDFVEKLEKELGYEITVTSGYRSPSHPIEIRKSKPGEHSTGLAVDVVASGGNNTYDLVLAAIELGCKRIGINRKKNFVHLGLDNTRVKSIWVY